MCIRDRINDSTENGPSLDNSDQFGYAVENIGDLNGDGVNDLAVGANKDGSGDRGAVHIMFMNTDGTVDETVEINDSTANGPALGNHDRFGSSIADIGDLNGDGVNDLAVGANLDDGTGAGQNKGAVHILFMNTDGTVDETVEINNATTNGPTLVGGDVFGTSITNIGDLNGDGVNDIAVGAEKDEMDENGNSSGGIDRGAIHIMLMNTDGSIDSIVEFNDFTTNGPTLSNRDQFGTSIVNIGDLDGNGINDLAVGAYLDDMDENGNSSGHNASGAIHILFLE